MIAALKRGALSLVGLTTLADPDWIRALRRQGYSVGQRHGAWHWHNPHSAAFSGRYTTEQAAWRAAEQDYEYSLEAL